MIINSAERGKPKTSMPTNCVVCASSAPATPAMPAPIGVDRDELAPHRGADRRHAALALANAEAQAERRMHEARATMNSEKQHARL